MIYLLIILVGIIIVFYFTQTLQSEGVKKPPESLSVYERMDQISQEVYQLTKEKKFPEAKGKLQELGNLFAAAKPPRGLTIETLDTITATLVNAKKAFAAVEIDPNQLLWNALQVRLTMDSLTHEKQPLWKNYYKTYKEHIDKMTLYIAGKKKDEFTKAFLQNVQLYQLLKPAMSVGASPQDMEQLLSIYRYLLQESRKADFDWSQVYQVLQELNRQVDKLFIGKETTTLASVFSPGSPYITISLIGAFLFASLGYVAYRKYRASKRY